MTGEQRHARAIEEAFSEQASAFEDERFNRAFTIDAEWLFERLPLKPDDMLLDVAAGTGHAARTLAPHVRGVVALDATAAMLEAGRAEADKAGLANIEFMRGDAASLPFEDASFDVAVSRFAVHHFQNPAVQAMEMVRCVRPGGSIALADMVADERPPIAATQDRLERLRDASHTQMLTAEQLAELLHDAGAGKTSVEVRSITRPVEPWLAHAKVRDEVAGAIKSELLAEMRGGSVTGLRPREKDNKLWFVQTFASVIGTKTG